MRSKSAIQTGLVGSQSDVCRAVVRRRSVTEWCCVQSALCEKDDCGETEPSCHASPPLMPIYLETETHTVWHKQPEMSSTQRLTGTNRIGQKNILDPNPNSGTVDPDPDTDRHQNLTYWSSSHAPPLQKFHQNLFITSGDILLTRNDYTDTYGQKNTHTHTHTQMHILYLNKSEQLSSAALLAGAWLVIY